MSRLKLGSYGVILADPPHKFRTRSTAGNKKSAERHYRTMDLEQICAIPVGSLAGEHCALFVWTCWPNIFQTESIIKRWGFQYSGLAWEWFKYNFNTMKFAFGPGYGTRKNVEPCLLARRGNPKILDRSVRDFIFEERREHSRKPDKQYELIERMYAGPRIELFARTRRKGWDVWGNEVDKFTPEESHGPSIHGRAGGAHR